MNPIEALQATFAQAQGDYPRLKAEIESRVVHWFWASDAMHAIEPFWFELSRYPKGKPLKAKPAKVENHYEYGVDAHGRIIVERQYALGGTHCYETFDFHQGSGILSYRFGYGADKTPDNVKRYVFEGDQLQAIYSAFEKQGYWVETFHHQAGRLVKKDVVYGSVGKPVQDTRTITYTYDTIGQLQCISEGDYVRYRQPDRKLSYPKLSAMVQERLLACLKTTIAQHAPREPLFGLTVAYGEQHALPPQLGFGTDAERKDWGEDSGIDIWNVAEYTHQFELETDQQDAALFDLFNQENEMNNKHSAARKVLLNCAVQLRAQVEALALERTADFAIAVTRFDALDLKKNFKTLYPERPELWR